MITGFDYTDRIAPADLKAANCEVVFRYVMPQTPFWTKALRNAEAVELRAAGFPIVSNFESSANRELAGAQGGHDDAVTLLADWKALGAPSGLVGWFSADWDVQSDEIPAVLAYLDGAARVLGGKKYVGCYGGYRVCAAAADAGYGVWQTVAWSHGQWDPRAAARQTGEQRTVGGVQVDVNEIIDLAALGAWAGSTMEDDVTPQDKQDIIDGVLAGVGQRVYDYGREPLIENGKVVRESVPLGNLAHGAWEALNDPSGAIPQMRSQINDLFHRPASLTAAQITSAVQTAIQNAVTAGLVTQQAGEKIAEQVVEHLSLTVGVK